MWRNAVSRLSLSIDNCARVLTLTFLVSLVPLVSLISLISLDSLVSLVSHLSSLVFCFSFSLCLEQ